MHNSQIKTLHEKAEGIVKIYKKCEGELISILQEMEKCRGYLNYNSASLYEYCTKILGLSEGVSYALIAIARKSVEIPALKEAIQSGELTVSKAHKIVSVVKLTNQEEWIDFAKTNTTAKIEKAVAMVNPATSIQESVKYRAEDLIELKIGISEKTLKKLERVIDLESQRTSKAMTKEEALAAALDLYLQRNDPVQKAERCLNKANKSENKTVKISSKQQFLRTVRKPIPTNVIHAIQKRDQGQCAHRYEDKTRCQSRRWLDIHHLKPIHLGGSNEADNLTTLCSQHHRQAHQST